ncbi:MAG: YnbE family lipoprotein [Micavibrio sp.]|nr:YnbE family lipoprotein [Micavibrio sp.]
MQTFKPAVASLTAIVAGLGVVLISGCTPTVRVETPDKPIEINMNIKIEQEVKVKVEKDLDDAIASDPSLFGLDTQKKK